MRTIFFYIMALCLAAGSALQAEGQNYIGMPKSRIIEEMQRDHKKFKLNRGTVNPHYNYLKYEDHISEITLLFFLSDDDVCTMVRMICDYSNINDVEKELNENYSRAGKNAWEDKKGDELYTIRLTEEDWYFTVTTKKKE